MCLLLICNNVSLLQHYKTTIHGSPTIESSTQIGHHEYNSPLEVEDLPNIIRLVRKEWFLLQNLVLDDAPSIHNRIVASRLLVNEVFQALIAFLQTNPKDLSAAAEVVEVFPNLMLGLDKLSEDVLVKLSRSANSTCPLHQFLHTFLELHYYLIVISILIKSQTQTDELLRRFLRDLIALSRKGFMRNRDSTQCECIKQCWAILRKFPTTPDHLKNTINALLNNEEPQFVFWLLSNNLASRDDVFFELVERKLKEFLGVSQYSNLLVDNLKIVQRLVNDLWLESSGGRYEVFTLIWSYFSSRLNLNYDFIVNKNAMELVALVGDVVGGKFESHEFGLFVAMLRKHLEVYPRHWGKIKGRLYSQLGPNKVRDLTDGGFAKVLLMYLSLGSLFHEEMAKMTVGLVENLGAERRRSNVVWNFYMAFLIRQLHEHRPIEPAVPTMLKMLSDAAQDPNHFHLISTFVPYFAYMTHQYRLDLQQWLLIDQWLPKYTATCSQLDLTSILSVFLNILEKFREGESSWFNWEPAFVRIIFPALKTMNTPHGGELAGRICRLSSNLANDSLQFYTAGSVMAPVSQAFLDAYLKDSAIVTTNQERLIAQAWMKIILFATDDSSHDLTLKIINFGLFPTGMKRHVLNNISKAFIAVVEYFANDLEEHLKSPPILNLCDLLFEKLDRIIAHYLSSNATKEALVFRCYTCVGLAFLHCGELLYYRSRSSSALTRLVSTMLLPTEFQIGKKMPHRFVVSSMCKTWHVYFDALAKLNAKSNDAYMDRTLRSLVVLYLPLYPIGESPLVRCLQGSYAGALLAKLSANYFIKEPIANVGKAMQILTNLLQSNPDKDLYLSVVANCLFGLLEMVVFEVELRNAALNAVGMIFKSRFYDADAVLRVVGAVTQKHMVAGNAGYFRMMTMLFRLRPQDAKRWFEEVKKQVVVVERARGVGYERTLRLSLDQLEKLL